MTQPSIYEVIVYFLLFHESLKCCPGFFLILTGTIPWPGFRFAVKTKLRPCAIVYQVVHGTSDLYEGCSKRIAYFYLETSNFK